MDWIDIASIVFACTAANHLGLVKAIEEVIDVDLPIVNCPKCFTFWCVLCYGCKSVVTYGTGIAEVFAISFLCAYIAIWVELGMGYIDTLYTTLYEKIYTNGKDYEASTDTYDGDSAGSVSELR